MPLFILLIAVSVAYLIISCILFLTEKDIGFCLMIDMESNLDEFLIIFVNTHDNGLMNLFTIMENISF